jgi:hypothetical protein
MNVFCLISTKVIYYQTGFGVLPRMTPGWRAFSHCWVGEETDLADLVSQPCGDVQTPTNEAVPVYLNRQPAADSLKLRDHFWAPDPLG